MIVRLPFVSFKITDENRAIGVEWKAQWSISIPRSRQSSMRNENALEVLRDPMNSHLAPNCLKTVQIFDAFPPRCQRPSTALQWHNQRISWKSRNFNKKSIITWWMKNLKRKRISKKNFSIQIQTCDHCLPLDAPDKCESHPERKFQRTKSIYHLNSFLLKNSLLNTADVNNFSFETVRICWFWCTISPWIDKLSVRQVDFIILFCISA